MTTARSKSKTHPSTNGFLVTKDTARWLALGAVASPILFTFAWVVLGLLRPAVKDAWGISGGVPGMMTQPVSGLGLGSNSFIFNAAFVLTGILLMIGVFGIFQTIGPNGSPAARRSSAVLLALTGLGSVVDGIFTLQWFFLHMSGFTLACGTPILSFLVAGLFLRRIPRWRRFGTWLLLGSPLTLLLIVIFFLNFNFNTMAAGLGEAGLTERILVLEVQAWFVAMGWLAFRSA
jgi:Protein of unknown function (DUF998)